MHNDGLRLRTLLESLSGDLPRPLCASEIDHCLCYYEQVLKWNPLLHLTTLITPEDFAVRHLGESFHVEARLLPNIEELWDIGSGAGIPGIPIAIRRPDLPIKLIESNRRKAIFLDESALTIGLAGVRVLSERFESMPLPGSGSGLTARAVERMETVVGKILQRGRESAQILILGNKMLASLIEREIPTDWQLESILLPSSSGRYLYDLRRSTWNKSD